ncbi:MAG TPA: HAMP domain-containing sensor histidine kinase, partial [Jatrophihabitans sp.]|nr:HAMP domain-containing sensor histidine kinase [Jatrophihabitans sp.]
DEIRTLATTLNTMLDRLDTATTKQRRFVGDAAHELRSPIASLRLQLEVAQRLDADGAVGELAGDALLDVDRLSNLIDDLLLLARSDEGGPDSAPRARRPVRLDELVAAVVAGYPEARVPVRAGRCLPAVVLGDSDGLHRVLLNLIDNAARYARSSVTVLVSAPAGEPGMVCLSVADDGPGVPAGEREHVFDRFYRLDDARSRAEGGTGLGLAIVRGIVTAHGGTVQLRDNEPGLFVDVLLPLAGTAQA